MSGLNPCILLTGATGYIGKHILWQLLDRGYRVIVIVRRNREGVRERVVELLKPLGPFPGACLEVIEGDLVRPECGIDTAVLKRLASTGVIALIHSAGLTRFESHLADELFLNNLQATKHVYALALQLGIKSFHYLSTAYVAGNTRQKFRSTDLDVGQGFNNPYEASKFEAEKFLSEAARRKSCDVIVYRPSIVVGGHPLGENNVVSTVYTFLKASHFIRECCRRDLERGHGIFARCGVRREGDVLFVPLRIAANPELSINLVPIESVVNRIITGLGRAVPGYTVVPLTGNDFSLGALHDAFCNALSIKGVRFVDGNTLESMQRTVIEENFFRATASYQPYLISAPDFAEEEKDKTIRIDIEKIATEFSSLLDAKVSEKKSGALNRLALNTLGVSGPQDYFYRFVNGQLGESFLKRIVYVDTKIRFLIRGEQEFDQVIHFDRGNIHYVKEYDYDCSYELDQLLFNDIVNGRTDLKEAFFDGLVRIEGDRETALKFGYLFSEHFRNIDDRIIEEMTNR